LQQSLAGNQNPALAAGHRDPVSGPGGPITAVLFNDPGCPFGYSAGPALRTLEWRYRDQIVWHLVTISLSDPGNPSPYAPADQARSWVSLRDRYGMPFAAEPKTRPVTTSRACRAIAAARLSRPGSEWRVLRTLQLLHFNTPLLLDDDDHLRAALETVPGLDAAAVVAQLDRDDTTDAYNSDWLRSRQAGHGPAWLQGRTADSPRGPRYTAPSLVVSHQGRSVEVGGFQPVEAYDAAIVNLDPGLNRFGPPESVLDALRLYPAGLVTAELAAMRSAGLEQPDPGAAEMELIGLLDRGAVRRVPLGSDALWLAV